MKTKVLLIGGIAVATVLAGGWALAQTQGHQHDATGTAGAAQHTQGMGPHSMGPARMQQMMQHMGHGNRQAMTHGAPGTTQPGTTQPRAAEPEGETGNAHQH